MEVISRVTVHLCAQPSGAESLGADPGSQLSAQSAPLSRVDDVLHRMMSWGCYFWIPNALLTESLGIHLVLPTCLTLFNFPGEKYSR